MGEGAPASRRDVAWQDGEQHHHIQRRDQCVREGGKWARALGLLCAMVQGRVESNTIAYSVATSAYEKGSEWATALELLGAMVQGRMERDNITYVLRRDQCV